MTQELRFSTPSGQSELHIGGSRVTLEAIVGASRFVVIAEHAIKHFLPDLLPSECETRAIVHLDGGESCKSLAVVEQLYQKLLQLEVDRQTLCIAVGGGALLDVAGFVASTYMRGIPLISIPTTLLAQVDASIGGKNGVDFQHFKNLIGTIRQPQHVILDTSTLRSLPQRDFCGGVAEVIKAGFIADATLINWLSENHRAVLAREQEMLEELISRAVRIKMEIVADDETEQGQRRKLNFGHTFGHALELELGLLHGEAVALGMVLELKFAIRQAWTGKMELQVLTELLSQYSLPSSLPAPGNFDEQRLIQALGHDKKRQANIVQLPVISAIGECHVRPVKLDELIAFLQELPAGIQ